MSLTTVSYRYCIVCSVELGWHVVHGGAQCQPGHAAFAVLREESKAAEEYFKLIEEVWAASPKPQYVVVSYDIATQTLGCDPSRLIKGLPVAITDDGYSTVLEC